MGLNGVIDMQKGNALVDGGLPAEYYERAGRSAGDVQ